MTVCKYAFPIYISNNEVTVNYLIMEVWHWDAGILWSRVLLRKGSDRHSSSMWKRAVTFKLGCAIFEGGKRMNMVYCKFYRLKANSSTLLKVTNHSTPLALYLISALAIIIVKSRYFTFLFVRVHWRFRCFPICCKVLCS